MYAFQTGIGPQSARDASQAVLARDSWDLAISSGFAGALVPCAIGTIVIAEDVLMDGSHFLVDPSEKTLINCDNTFRVMSFQIACSVDVESQCGRLVTCSHIVGEASEKSKIAVRTEAVAIDMESAVLGCVAQQRGIPFIVVRTISDLVDEDLPLDFNLFLRRQTWVRGVGQVLQRPGSLLLIPRLRRQMLEASEKLTEFFIEFFDNIEDAREQHV